MEREKLKTVVNNLLRMKPTTRDQQKTGSRKTSGKIIHQGIAHLRRLAARAHSAPAANGRPLPHHCKHSGQEQGVQTQEIRSYEKLNADHRQSSRFMRATSSMGLNGLTT